jgi:hypothetical protein
MPTEPAPETVRLLQDLEANGFLGAPAGDFDPESLQEALKNRWIEEDPRAFPATGYIRLTNAGRKEVARFRDQMMAAPHRPQGGGPLIP